MQPRVYHLAELNRGRPVAPTDGLCLPETPETLA